VPQRPRSHQVADESRRAFERALPSHWVFRPQQPDYGIDGEVEVFDESGASTGLRFYVQLKATDGTAEQARLVRVTREVGRYYSALDLPVLIVSYHAPTGTLYARWFQEINPPEKGEENGTVSVKFEDTNRWTSQTPSLLVRDLVTRRTLRGGAVTSPLLTAIDVEPSDAHSVLVSELTSAVVRLRGIIELSDANRALATIAIGPSKIAVRLGKEFSRSMGIPSEVENYRALAADTLLLLALALGRARQYALAGKIALAVVDSSVIIERPEVFGPLTSYLATGHRLADALELSDRLATKYGSTWAAEALQSLALTSQGMSAAELVVYERYLDRRIELAKAAGDNAQLGTAYYNRGNSRQGTNRREALRDYLIAARTDPEYWNRDYFCSELGGLFFGLRRFKCAAISYQRSIDRGAGAETIPLLADALMFSGQYEQAKIQFGLYLDQAKELSPQWRLKDWALTQILKLGVKSQTRQTRAALSLADNPATLDDALRLDALCGLAWCNKGAGQLAVKNRRMAFVFYLLAAVSQDWDVEAWRNAYALALEHEEDQKKVAPYILMAAYEIHGERFLEELAQATQGPAEKKSEFIDRLRTMLDEWLPGKRWVREMRILGPNAEYISFDLGSRAMTHSDNKATS
jgi:tetratricopeptide (TPR) repeat protein